MSKKYLEAFKRLNEDDSDYALKQATKDIETVGQALQRLESIDNANPSEALNITKATEKYTGIDLSIVKQALLKAQEQEKVLEIIKKKQVDMKLFFNALFREQQYKINPLEFYNGSVGYKRLWLTQEEFDLLKEMLK